jgi:hypothetical protein
MIEGDHRSSAIAKIEIVMQRNPGVKELLEKLEEERKKETVRVRDSVLLTLNRKLKSILEHKKKRREPFNTIKLPVGSELAFVICPTKINKNQKN